MSFGNSGLKGVFWSIEPRGRGVQFCNTRRKNIETQGGEPFFQLRFERREVILESIERQAMHF
jgi:hypothetical protein